jgi:hypothetical protein
VSSREKSPAGAGLLIAERRSELVSNAAPHFIRVDFFIRIQCASLLQESFGRLRICRISNAAIVDRAYSRALRFVEMPDAFSATIMRNDVDIIPNALTVSYMIAFTFSIAARLENGLVGTLR